MNWRRLVVAVGSSVFALVLMYAAVWFSFLLTFAFSLPGSGPSEGEKLLYFTVIPAAAIAGETLVAWGSGSRGWRMVASAGVAFLVAAYWVSENLMSPGEEGFSVQSSLLLISALCVMIATFRRPEVTRWRAAIVYALAAASTIGAAR